MNRSSDKRRDSNVLSQAVLAAMTVVAGTSASQANTVTLVGGGATLPAPAYVGPANAILQTRLVDDFIHKDLPGSLFAAYTKVTSGGPLVSYCQTGSGTGKKILEGVSGFSALSACPLFSQTPFGFGGSEVYPDFAASDSPFAASDVSAFYVTGGAGSSHAAPAQFPSVAGVITIAFNNPNITTTANITTSQICGVFAGTITNWNQLGAYPSEAIEVVYRSDGSGTSFNFSNHLAAVCNGTSTIFQTNQTWSGGVLASVPGNEIGESGNPGVVTYISTHTGSIGYAEYGDAIALVPRLQTFNVDNVAPTNVSSTLAVSATTGMVISSTNNSNGTPALVAVSSTDTSPGCLLLVDPNSYSQPTSGYSIVGLTYLMAYTSNNPNRADVVALLGAPYNASVRSLATDVVPSLGYAWLSLGSDPTSTISGCVGL